MRDYSKYEKTPVLFSGAEKKFEIIIDGYRYIVKFQKNSEVGLIFNYVSEYLGKQNNQTTTSDFPCNFNFTVSNMNRFNQGIDHG